MNKPINIEGVTINTQKIQQFIEDNCYSRRKFAQKCNIGENLLHKILSGNANVRFTGLMQIAEFMGVELDELLNL